MLNKRFPFKNDTLKYCYIYRIELQHYSKKREKHTIIHSIPILFKQSTTNCVKYVYGGYHKIRKSFYGCESVFRIFSNYRTLGPDSQRNKNTVT